MVKTQIYVSIWINKIQYFLIHRYIYILVKILRKKSHNRKRLENVRRVNCNSSCGNNIRVYERFNHFTRRIEKMQFLISFEHSSFRFEVQRDSYTCISRLECGFVSLNRIFSFLTLSSEPCKSHTVVESRNERHQTFHCRGKEAKRVSDMPIILR